MAVKTEVANSSILAAYDKANGLLDANRGALADALDELKFLRDETPKLRLSLAAAERTCESQAKNLEQAKAELKARTAELREAEMRCDELQKKARQAALTLGGGM